MLSLIIFLPLLAALVVLFLPEGKPRLLRGTALAGACGSLLGSLLLWLDYDYQGEALQMADRVRWIPSVGASYHVAVSGFSLPLIVLAALLTTMVMIYLWPKPTERARFHTFLFLVMATGLMGVFAAQDLLLFYLFFEVGLVPMYFIVGVWGHERRHYAAMKFFLYTRAGSLALLLSFLGLYLAMEPHTFSIPEILAAQPLSGSPKLAALVLLGMVIGFGVKLPILPIHNWLPDAHVEAPTEGSVILAGVQLKMGAYGFIFLLPAVAGAARVYGPVLMGLGVATLIYGALAALGQTDLKRLVAYSSINHMGYVLIAVAAAAVTTDPQVRSLALSGATLQAVSHGLLTGGMFFLVGMLYQRADTRDINSFGGLLGRAPGYSVLLGLLAFGSLGLPGLSGFIAEFQVITAALQVSVVAAVFTVIGLLITTGLYIRVLMKVVVGEAPPEMPPVSPLVTREWIAVAPLVVLSILIGLFPAPLLALIERGAL